MSHDGFSYEAGSTLTGTEVDGSDVDYIEVYVESESELLGLSEAETDQRKTEVGDTTRYPLRKWASLASQGNPNLVAGLFAPEDKIDYGLALHSRFADNSNLFVSKYAAEKFRGYAWSQLLSLQGKKAVRAPHRDLVDKYGYDTKFAMHALRLAYQGIELMNTGRLQLPMQRYRNELIDVRNGEYTQNWVVVRMEHLMLTLDHAVTRSALPETADYDAINDLLIQTYKEAWQW